jgi:hypothetical protein
MAPLRNFFTLEPLQLDLLVPNQNVQEAAQARDHNLSSRAAALHQLDFTNSMHSHNLSLATSYSTILREVHSIFNSLDCGEIHLDFGNRSFVLRLLKSLKPCLLNPLSVPASDERQL